MSTETLLSVPPPHTSDSIWIIVPGRELNTIGYLQRRNRAFDTSIPDVCENRKGSRTMREGLNAIKQKERIMLMSSCSWVNEVWFDQNDLLMLIIHVRCRSCSARHTRVLHRIWWCLFMTEAAELWEITQACGGMYPVSSEQLYLTESIRLWTRGQDDLIFSSLALPA